MIRVMAKVLTRILVSAEFEGLTGAQRSAVIESLAITVVRSGRTSDADRQRLRQDLLDLPWAWEPDESSPDGLADRRGLQLSRLEDNGMIERLGSVLARTLEDRRLCEQVFRLMAALAYADGAMDRDLEALDSIRIAFGVRIARAREIIDELKAELVGLVV